MSQITSTQVAPTQASQQTPSASTAAGPQSTAAATARVKAGIEPWSVDDASELYNLRGWGKGFFEISKQGHVLVRPRARRAARSICSRS
jgi:arginine decarboxylase-like protein